MKVQRAVQAITRNLFNLYTLIYNPQQIVATLKYESLMFITVLLLC